MRIVLDTNIYAADPLLSGSNFKLLFDYLSAAESEVYMPQIVFEELRGVHRRSLDDAASSFRASTSKLKRLIVGGNLPDWTVDIDHECNALMESLKAKMKVRDENMLPFRNDWLPDLVSRACKRIRPFDGDGNGFRDAILWLCILDLAEASREETVVLISGDRRAFADSEGNLHPDLANEAGRREVDIQYFCRLVDFIKSKKADVEFIDISWIESAVDEGQVRDLLHENMLDMWGIRNLEDLIREKRSTYAYYSHVKVRDVSVEAAHVVDYFVYELEDSSLNVRVTFECEVLVERDPLHYDDRNPEEWLYVTAYFDLHVRNRELLDVQYVEWVGA